MLDYQSKYLAKIGGKIIGLAIFAAVFWLVGIGQPGEIYAASYLIGGQAQSSGTGNYLDFAGYGSNVLLNMTTGNFSGYAYSVDVGWVAFGTTDNPSGPVTMNTSTGVVTGKAFAISTGKYIDFTNYGSNVVYNSGTGNFSGYVYSEDIGWFNFGSPGVSTVSFSSMGSKDVLSSTQLSYFAALKSGNAGDSQITVGSSAPVLDTNNLFIGDTIGIGIGSSNGALTKYVVSSVGGSSSISLNNPLSASNAIVGAAIIATRSAIHTFYWTPQSVMNSGFWQFLIEATSNIGEVSNDGIPDQGGFDLGQDVGSTTIGLGTRLKPADVSCPNFATGVGSTNAYSIGTTTVSGSAYHVITCAMGVGATNRLGVGYTAIVGRDLSVGSQLINPSPRSDNNQGNADILKFYILYRDSANNLLSEDTVAGKIGLVEAVRVSATIDPLITFTIDNTALGVGSTPCSLPALGAAAANTTADAVNFGSLSLGAFNNLAQRLSVVTNAAGGYVVTVYEPKTFYNLSSGATIPDAVCDGGCSASTAASWSSNVNQSQWGYTLQNIGGTAASFTFSTGYKAFGQGAANAKTIMANVVTPLIIEQTNICYRMTVSNSQPAGNYENQLIYTATARF